MEYHYFLLMSLLWFLISKTQQVVSVLVTWFLLQLDCPLDLRGFPVYVWTHFPEFHIYHVMTLVLTKQIVYFSCHKTWINQYEEITQYQIILSCIGFTETGPSLVSDGSRMVKCLSITSAP